jgi:Staphylococcal nuclease homologue
LSSDLIRGHRHHELILALGPASAHGAATFREEFFMAHMSWRKRAVVSSLLLFAGWQAQAADALYPVVTVPAPDRVVVLTKNFPVVLGLAHIAVPEDDAGKAALQKFMSEQLKGKRVSIMYSPGFGTDQAGAAKVHFLLDEKNLNETILAEGLARFQEGSNAEPAFERGVRAAEEKAKKAKKGIWKVSEVAKVSSKPSPVAAQKKGPFVSELETPYFFTSDSSEAAKLNPQRVIYYPDAATAERAGKKAKAKIDTSAMANSGSEKDTDAMFEKGKAAYNAAIDKGNTPERDTKYEEAFQYLTKAMQGYSTLAEKDPNNEALAEKLRHCMQLRYGTVKQRRFH